MNSLPSSGANCTGQQIPGQAWDRGPAFRVFALDTPDAPEQGRYQAVYTSG
jgi:hypothetical protein